MRLLSYKNIVFLLLCAGVLFSGQAVFGAVSSLGKMGNTYRIVERDALDEITEKAKNLDWAKLAKKGVEQVKKYVPSDAPKQPLPDAEKDNSFLVDMSYSLEFDVYDPDGNLIYPKGYTINPFDYVSFPNTLVFIDADKEEQVKWYMESPYYKDHKTMLLITKGSYYDLMFRTNRPVYYASELMIKRLQVKALPSVVYQKGKFMEVREYAIKKKNKS